MRTIEKTIYEFDELSEEVQKKLKDRERDYLYNDFCELQLEDCVYEEALDILKDNFKNTMNVNVLYDFSYSQGSGAMIEFDVCLENLNEKYKLISDEDMKVLSEFGNTFIMVKHNNACYYYHEKSFEVDYPDYNNWYVSDWSDEKTNKVQDKIEELIIKFKEDIYNMNKELTKRGYEILEYTPDDDLLMERLNEFEYYEDGVIYYVK